MNTDDYLAEQFKQETPVLASNFSWLVMQRIVAIKVEIARRTALVESTLLGVAALLLAIVGSVGYSAYAESASLVSYLSFQSFYLLPVACALVLSGLWLLDFLLAPRN